MEAITKYFTTTHNKPLVLTTQLQILWSTAIHLVLTLHHK